MTIRRNDLIWIRPPLASGGMAEVWRVINRGAQGVQSLCIVKRILVRYADREEFKKMFVDEARITALLHRPTIHPNIIQVLEFQEFQNEYLLFLEYINGASINEIFKKCVETKVTFPIPYTLHIISEVLSGLYHAHIMTDSARRNLNIIHRDISPANVLVSYSGDVKIIDWGIADAAHKSYKTTVGVIKGKYGYMSPEQANAKSLDHRTDIYSAGVLLWEMLTGRRLFKHKNSFKVLRKIQQGEIKNPGDFSSKISSELSKICLKAMAKQREARFSDALGFSEALIQERNRIAPDFSKRNLGKFLEEIFRKEIEKDAVVMAEAEKQEPSEIPPDYDLRERVIVFPTKLERRKKGKPGKAFDPGEVNDSEKISALKKYSSEKKNRDSEVTSHSESRRFFSEDNKDFSGISFSPGNIFKRSNRGSDRLTMGARIDTMALPITLLFRKIRKASALLKLLIPVCLLFAGVVFISLNKIPLSDFQKILSELKIREKVNHILSGDFIKSLKTETSITEKQNFSGPDIRLSDRERFKKACQEGLSKDCFRFAMMEIGEGKRESARIYLKKACDGGHSNGCFNLGNIEESNGKTKTAGFLFKRACHGGNSDGCHSFARIKLNSGNAKVAKKYFKKACDQGKTEACFSLRKLATITPAPRKNVRAPGKKTGSVLKTRKTTPEPAARERKKVVRQHPRRKPAAPEKRQVERRAAKARRVESIKSETKRLKAPDAKSITIIPIQQD